MNDIPDSALIIILLIIIIVTFMISKAIHRDDVKAYCDDFGKVELVSEWYECKPIKLDTAE